MTKSMTRLASTSLHEIRFDQAPVTRRGYDIAQVDGFVHQVRCELQRREQDYADLLAERNALLHENGSLQVKLGHLDANQQGQLISAQAVSMLSNAQRQIEAVFAEAEDQSRQMTLDARAHCDGILAQAQQQAQAVLDEAHRTASAAGNMAATAYRAASTTGKYEAMAEEQRRQLAYQQAFSHVWKSQMQAIVARLSTEIDNWPPDDPPTSAPEGS